MPSGGKAFNDISLGIELEGDDITPLTNAQYHALAEAVVWLMARYPQLDSDVLRAMRISHRCVKRTRPGV